MVIAAYHSETLGTSAAVRPTPEQIDAVAKRYNEAKLDKVSATLAFEEIEDEAIRMVTQFGIVPPNAEKSRRLSGRMAELTVTRADNIVIDDERVIDLRDALDSVGRLDFFKRLFSVRTKYEIVDDAEKALRSESLPKRLAEKVLNLYGRCLKPKPKSPSLKVTLADPAKPVKTPRAKRVAEETHGGAK